jgi:hypothetical protein
VAKGLRRHATTLGLLACVLGLGGYLLWLEGGHITTDEALVRADNLVPAWRADDITRITLTREGRSVRLERDAKSGGEGPGLFQLIEGERRFPGSEQAIDAYLGRLEFARFDRRVADASVNREAFGLAAPKLVVALRMGELEHQLRFGGEAPSPAGAMYVEVAGRGVFVVTKDLYAALDVPVDTLRSTDFVPYVSSELRALTIATASERVRLVRAAADSSGAAFELAPDTPPDATLGPLAGRRVGAASMQLWLATLGALDAESFPPEDEAKRASLATLTLTLSPTNAGTGDAALVLGGPCPGKPEQVVALRHAPSELVACVGKGLAETLTQSAAKLVDRKLIGAAVDEVAEVTLREGEHVVELARAGLGFRQRLPREADVSAEVGRALIDAVARVELTRFVTAERSELGLEPPRATLRFVSASPDRSRERVEVVRVGRTLEGSVAIEREEDGARGWIAEDALPALLPNDLLLRPRSVVREAAKRVRAVVLQGGASEQRIERGEDGAFTLAKPRGRGLALDSTFADELVEALTTLDAERWLAASDTGGFGLESPRWTVTVDLDADGEAKARTLTLLLGAKTARGSHAKRSDDDAVFLAPASLEARLGTSLVARGSLTSGLDDATRVTLRQASGRPRVLLRSGAEGGFQLEGGSDTSLAAALGDALADLLPEAAVTVGPAAPGEGLAPPLLVLEASGAKGTIPARILFGAGDTYRGARVIYARRDGVDATFAVADAKVRGLLDALGARDGAR